MFANLKWIGIAAGLAFITATNGAGAVSVEVARK